MIDLLIMRLKVINIVLLLHYRAICSKSCDNKYYFSIKSTTFLKMTISHQNLSIVKQLLCLLLKGKLSWP